MATTNSESLTELERRAETTRAELAQTVDALHSRVSPSALKADVRSYVRDNPLQAAAIAVGVAYPVWRIVGSIPAPVLLIGAGLAMTRRGGSGESYERNAYASNGSSGGMMATLKDKVSEVTSQVTGKAHETMDTVRSVAADKTSSAADTLSDSYQSARDAATERAQQVADQVSETYARTRESLADMIERHPLLVGGAAFAIGSIVAAAVPVSRQESRLLGETSEDVRRRATDVAVQGLREAGRAAKQVYRTATEEVGREGLTPEAARHTARAAVDRAREAVEHTTSGQSQHGGPSGPSQNNP